MSATAVELELVDQALRALAERAPPRAPTTGRRTALAKKPPRAAAMAADHDVLAHRHGAEQGEVLEGAADAQPRRSRGAARASRSRPSKRMLPSLDLVEPAQAVEERRLAGAVRADQAADQPGLTSKETPSSATMPPKRTDNPLMLSSGAPVSGAAAVGDGFASSDTSICRFALITWSAIIAQPTSGSCDIRATKSISRTNTRSSSMHLYTSAS